MKITKIDIMLLKTGDSAPRDSGCRPIICRIHTDEGIYGDGEAAMLLMSGALATCGMLKDLAERIIGMDPLGHEVIWNKLYRTTYFAQHGGPIMYAAISAIDMALWDIKGKYYNEPVWKLLGGKFRDELPCYASQIHSGWGRYLDEDAHTPEEFYRNACEAREDGYNAVKVDCLISDETGRRLGTGERHGVLTGELLNLAVERVAAVREGIGEDGNIILEGHAYMDVQTGRQFAQRLEPYRILYFEEPCTTFLPNQEYLNSVIPMPLAGGERLFTRWQYMPYVQAHAYQLLQPDVGNCGGITELMKIIDLAEVYELGVQLHCVATPIGLAAALNVEAAMPRFVYHEHTGFQQRDFVRRLGAIDYQPENGVFRVPDEPGIGNTLSQFALDTCEKFTV